MESEGLTYYSDTMRHLVCVPYNEHNLHAMALRLGIKRCWFHRGRFPHYDIPKRRLVEIRARTVQVSSRRILEICKKGFLCS
jgi:FMN phosphatase YigB (HAD superfamily)